MQTGVWTARTRVEGPQGSEVGGEREPCRSLVTVVERLPDFIPPMLLTTANEVPTDKEWALEVKWDGMRAQLRFDGRRVTLRSRAGRDCTAQFASCERSPRPSTTRCCSTASWSVSTRGASGLRAAALAAACPNRRRGHGGAGTAPATLIVFDVLHLAGRSTRRLPYRERRALLESLALEGPAWRTPRTFAVDEDLVAVTASTGSADTAVVPR